MTGLLRLECSWRDSKVINTRRVPSRLRVQARVQAGSGSRTSGALYRQPFLFLSPSTRGEVHTFKATGAGASVHWFSRPRLAKSAHSSFTKLAVRAERPVQPEVVEPPAAPAPKPTASLKVKVELSDEHTEPQLDSNSSLPPDNNGGNNSSGGNGGGDGDPGRSPDDDPLKRLFGAETILAFGKSWGKMSFAQKFFLAGLAAHLAAHCIPSKLKPRTVDDSLAAPPGYDPFVDMKAVKGMTAAEKLQLVAFAPLTIWRLLMTAGICTSYFVYANFIISLVKDQGKRYKLLAPVTKVWLCRASLWLLGMRLKLRGEKHFLAARSQGDGFVVVANHISYLDFLAAGAVLGPGCVVAKAAIRSYPGLGAVAEGLGAIFIDRNTSGQGKAAIIAQRARTKGAGRDLAPLTVFPEGTVSNGDCLIRFRTGAFAPGVPTLPLTLRYSTASGLSPAWVAPLPTPVNMFRIFSEPYTDIHVDILPMYRPSEKEQKKAPEYASNVQRVMAKHLGVPVCNDCNVGDNWAKWKAYTGEDTPT